MPKSRTIAFRKGVKPEVVKDALMLSIIDQLTPEQMKAAQKTNTFRQLVRDIGLKMLMRTSQSDDPWVLRVAQETARTLLMDVQAEAENEVAKEEVTVTKMARERELMILQERVHNYLREARGGARGPQTITQQEWLANITPKGISDHDTLPTVEDAEEASALSVSSTEEEGVLIDGATGTLLHGDS